MELLQERYDAGTLTTLIEQGTANPFHLSLQAGKIAEVLNTAYANRVDIDKQLEINGVPVKIHIRVDKTDGMPWSRTFTLNLTRAGRNGRVVDVDKIGELAERYSVPGKKIVVKDIIRPFWTNGGRDLQIFALNLPPGNIVHFFNTVLSEAIR